jgi:hypothetical protein
MSLFRNIVLTGTTNSSGDVTVDAEIPTPGWMVYSVEWVVGTWASGVDAVFSDRGGPGGVAKTFLTLTNANSNAVYRPRAPMHDNAGAAISSQYTYYEITGRIRMVVAQGGNTFTGSAIVYLIKE